MSEPQLCIKKWLVVAGDAVKEKCALICEVCPTVFDDFDFDWTVVPNKCESVLVCM